MTHWETVEARAPTRARIVFVYYAARCFLAALLAFPWALALTSAGVTRALHGDAVLFAPGGIYLIEALRLGHDALRTVWGSTPWTLIVTVLLGLLPTAFLMSGLGRPGAPLDHLISRTLDVFPRFVLLRALALLAQASTLALLVFFAFKAQAWVGEATTPERGDLAWVGVVVVGSPAFVWISLLHDLARAATVLQRSDFGECLRVAQHALRNAPFRIFAAWLAPLGCAVLLAGGVGLAVGKLRVEAGDDWRWISVLALHQAVILAFAVAESRWLEQALGVVTAREHASDPWP